MPTLVIEKGIKMSSYRRASMAPQNIQILEAMEKAEVGDSFYVDRNRRSVAVFVSKRSILMGLRFSTTKEGEGTRICRVA